ncbi:hypothetical protein LTR56_017198 [Elasticomyces elasticus]|nr:hypothetical protein LTR56_017198 [Elasticomyces elasticus]KAK3666314.1 hypothetical protein LTR22_002978 [Elasticomyces elasticus]KAK4926910.1 hypothetical protein LTR49_006326 [Elasticomyces elasticus]
MTDETVSKGEIDSVMEVADAEENDLRRSSQRSSLQCCSLPWPGSMLNVGFFRETTTSHSHDNATAQGGALHCEKHREQGGILRDESTGSNIEYEVLAK